MFYKVIIRMLPILILIVMEQEMIQRVVVMHGYMLLEFYSLFFNASPLIEHSFLLLTIGINF